MQVIKSSYKIEEGPDFDGMALLRRVELAGRTCYKSAEFCDSNWDKERTLKFIQNLISRGHESVLEHEKLTIRFICDRGVSHELVRHRLASFSQESTRYCNYSKDKFGNEITVISPSMEMFGDSYLAFEIWRSAMEEAEKYYFALLREGCKPEIARSVLPNSLKTEIVITANMREWRHILKLRTALAAHPQMRELMTPLLNELQQKIPVLFDDIIVQ